MFVLPTFKNSFAIALAIIAITQRHSAWASQDSKASYRDAGESGQPALHYGRCYTMKNLEGEDLGHELSDWNNLRFGRGSNKASFLICQNIGHCIVYNTPSQLMPNTACFWLFDLEGNKYSPGGHFIAADSPPFNTSRYLHAAGGSARYYVNFWGLNDCAHSDSRPLGACPVQVYMENLRDHQGLAIEDGFIKAVESKYRHITVTFHEIACPEETIFGLTDKDSRPEL